LIALVGNAQAQRSSIDDPSTPIDKQNLDTSVKPSEDFYQYANGGWMVKNPIPPDQSRWGSFNEVQERNYVILHEILDAAARATDAPKGSNLQKVGDFYFSGMDSAGIEQLGTKPLESEFSRIAALKTPHDLQSYFAHLQTIGVNVPFSFYVDQDAKQSTQVIAQFRQGGLGLPNRDYYTKPDAKSQETRDKYLIHVGKMFSLLGDDPVASGAHASTVLAMETRLAGASMTNVELRDPEKVYHKMTLEELGTLTPGFSWNRYFEDLGVGNASSVNVEQPEFMKEAGKMFSEVPIDDWKTYLRWHLTRACADYLSSAFVNERFEFNGKILTGAKELRPRWKRCLAAVDGNLGEALGELYVAKAFSPQAKARAKELIHNLSVALGERIKGLSWMSEPTKQQALHKLDAFTVKIGYPDKFRDYTGLVVDRGPYVLNVMRAEQFDFKRNIAKIGKPVDRGEWGMTPPTVNAYYNPTMNEIVFPAGILQPPFFFANADDAVNYGGIGAVIGHEMTHGFDDQGRQFDADGNLKDWWTPEDGKNYDARAKMVEDQFSSYTVLDTLHLNGKFTLGENIADLGGLTIAYAALQKALEGKPRAAIDGYTPGQRFFLSWAQVWRTNIRPEALRLRVLNDPHSPGHFRCNGPVSNMEEFKNAFEVPDTAPMLRSPDSRAKIW
jgi:putative endopeptidase